VVHEPSWRERERIARQRPRGPRGRAARRLVGPVLVLALVAAAGVVGLGYTGRGPYDRLARTSEDASADHPAPAAAGTTSTTEMLFVARTYQPGDCVTWDQAPGRAERVTEVVRCDRPHLVEMTGHLILTDRGPAYPTGAEWEALIRDRCREPAEHRLGGPLDPHGRFSLHALQPTSMGWAGGGRDLWCGLSASWRPPGQEDATGPDVPLVPLTEAMRHEDQFWRYTPGACIARGANVAVACTDPHIFEVTGEATVDERPGVPAREDTAGWSAIVGDACRARARGYLRHEPVDPWRSGLITIEPESWAAGQRNVTCYLGRWGGDAWEVVTASARSTSS
jgi:hypothetical protein